MTKTKHQFDTLGVGQKQNTNLTH